MAVSSRPTLGDLEVTAEPRSPCLAVCRLDPESRTCEGCGRTAREIARWPFADRDEKLRILEALAARRALAAG